MKLLDFKNTFRERLMDEYPAGEVDSFFNLLTEEYLGISRLDLALDPAKNLTPAQEGIMEKVMLRLLKHEPIQYILGKTEFFGLPFQVNSSVLIPRPETEELVQWILDDLELLEKPGPSILDIGTGSGCIAISLAKNCAQAKISAIDISLEALKTANSNALLNEVEIEFIIEDILALEKLKESYDIIVSNPPYVRELEKKQMYRNVLENEPHLALYVKDEDPLLFYKKITKLAEGALAGDAPLYFEINQYLAEETEAWVKGRGFKTWLRKDIYGNYRMLKAVRITDK